MLGSPVSDVIVNHLVLLALVVVLQSQLALVLLPVLLVDSSNDIALWLL